MNILRFDAWCYRLGMVASVVAVAVAIPTGLVVIVLWLVNLL